MDDVLDGAIRKAARRLVPFLCLLYLVNYLDRVNISVAMLTMISSLGLSATVFGIGLYGTVFWMPQIVRTFGVSTLANGFVIALPYALSVIVMVLWGRHSDATGERTWHVAIPLLFSAAGFVVASLWLDRPVIAMAGLPAACVGIDSTLPVFWTLPGRFLTGPAIAGAFALITSLGNLSGIAVPPIVGWTKDATGGFTLAMARLAGALVLAGLLAFACRSPQQGRLRTAEA